MSNLRRMMMAQTKESKEYYIDMTVGYSITPASLELKYNKARACFTPQKDIGTVVVKKGELFLSYSIDGTSYQSIGSWSNGTITDPEIPETAKSVIGTFRVNSSNPTVTEDDVKEAILLIKR